MKLKRFGPAQASRSTRPFGEMAWAMRSRAVCILVSVLSIMLSPHNFTLGPCLKSGIVGTSPTEKHIEQPRRLADTSDRGGGTSG